jgi:hypothetical protein
MVEPAEAFASAGSFYALANVCAAKRRRHARPPRSRNRHNRVGGTGTFGALVKAGLRPQNSR